ncbi:MAG: hypothetical protein AAFP69_22530, partial [Planctomycetota bacterium]
MIATPVQSSTPAVPTGTTSAQPITQQIGQPIDTHRVIDAPASQPNAPVDLRARDAGWAQFRMLINRAAQDPERIALELVYDDGIFVSRRLVSPIRWIDRYNVMCMCLDTGEPRNLRLGRIRIARTIPAAEVIMPAAVQPLMLNVEIPHEMSPPGEDASAGDTSQDKAPEPKAASRVRKAEKKRWKNAAKAIQRLCKMMQGVPATLKTCQIAIRTLHGDPRSDGEIRLDTLKQLRHAITEGFLQPSSALEQLLHRL